jgi:hypothetical protein
MGKTSDCAVRLPQGGHDPVSKRADTPRDTQRVPTASGQETVIALLAMLLIALICRWVFTPTHTSVRRPADPADYGLLVPVTRALSAEDAAMLRDHLVAEGVRASVNDAHDVLVFRDDLRRAQELVGSS